LNPLWCCGHLIALAVRVNRIEMQNEIAVASRAHNHADARSSRNRRDRQTSVVVPHVVGDDATEDAAVSPIALNRLRRAHRDERAGIDARETLVVAVPVPVVRTLRRYRGECESRKHHRRSDGDDLLAHFFGHGTPPLRASATLRPSQRELGLFTEAKWFRRTLRDLDRGESANERLE